MIPSDILTALRKLEFLHGVKDLHQLLLVIDTNIILRDLRWTVSRRKSPAARTALQELIASETVIAYAPSALRAEVQEHLPEVALELGLGEYELRAAWHEYERRLHFYSEKPSADTGLQSVRDPDDLPFLRLYQLVGAAAVYTLDKDVPAMGAPAISPEVVLVLRDYARAASVELTVGLGGVVVLTLGVESVRSFIAVMERLGDLFFSLPKQVQIALLITGAVALIHPSSQRRIKDGLENVPNRMIDGIIGLTPVLVKLAETFTLAQLSAKKSWDLVEVSLETPKRRPARVRAFALCLAADKPLSEAKIEFEMRQSGYKSKSNNFPTYLRRVLRHDPRFVEAPAGYWSAKESQ